MNERMIHRYEVARPSLWCPACGGDGAVDSADSAPYGDTSVDVVNTGDCPYCIGRGFCPRCGTAFPVNDSGCFDPCEECDYDPTDPNNPPPLLTREEYEGAIAELTRMKQAAAEYIGKAEGKIRPTQYGKWRSGQWFPDAGEYQDCCNDIRGPSRRWPYSYLRHCSTVKHIAVKYGLDEREFKKFLKGELVRLEFEQSCKKL